jgi:hypothetical protein
MRCTARPCLAAISIRDRLAAPVAASAAFLAILLFARNLGLKSSTARCPKSRTTL